MPLTSLLALGGSMTVAAVLSVAQPSAPLAPEAPTTKRVGDAYTLNICPISKQKLGAKGDPVVRVYDGREVRFCCGGCPGRFEADLAASFKELDAAMVKDQKPYFPAMTCPVSGEPLMEDGKEVGIDLVYNNRLVRLCCKGCKRGFAKDPAAHVKKLDAAVVKAQAAHYPIKECVVSGEALGSMGEPVDIVVANRLVRLCCKGCMRSLEKDPVAVVAKLDAAWKKQGMPGAHAHGKGEHGHAHGAKGEHGRGHEHGSKGEHGGNGEHGGG